MAITGADIGTHGGPCNVQRVATGGTVHTTAAGSLLPQVAEHYPGCYAIISQGGRVVRSSLFYPLAFLGSLGGVRLALERLADCVELRVVRPLPVVRVSNSGGSLAGHTGEAHRGTSPC